MHLEPQLVQGQHSGLRSRVPLDWLKSLIQLCPDSQQVTTVLGKYPFSLKPVGHCMLSHFSGIRVFVTLQTVACQALLSMGFSRQESWSGLPCPTPGGLPNPEIHPALLHPIPV